MKLTIRKIGNSKGIILPKRFLEECFIDDEVKIEVKEKHIIISAPDDTKRKDWDHAFKQMAANGDDELVIPDAFDDEEITDWKW